jgi:hypothetical protein
VEDGDLIAANDFNGAARTGDLRGTHLWHIQDWFSENFAPESDTLRLDGNRQMQSDQPRSDAVSPFEAARGSPARNPRNEKPRPFSNSSTVAVTSSTGYRTVASP